MGLLKRALDLGGWAVLFVAVLEVSARLEDRLVSGVPWLSSPSLADLQVSDETGIRGRPFARFEKWHLNSLGVQGPEVSLPKPRGTLRVVVLGASESFGPYESRGMAYPLQLQRMLAERLTRPVEVLNAALPGMTLPRVTEFCRSHLARLEPDVVVYYPSPVSYLLDDPPSETARPADDVRRQRWRFLPKLSNGINHSLPAALQAWRLERGQRRALAALRESRPESWLFRQVPQDRLALFETHLNALVDCLAHTGARPIVATHANRFPERPTADDQIHLTAWQVFYPRAEGSVLLAMDRAANDVIRRVALPSRAYVADVALAVPTSARYFRDFVHFTDTGSTLVAKTLQDVILDDVQGSSGPGTRDPTADP